MQGVVEAFSGKAYGLVWDSNGHVVGPQIRIALPREDAERFFVRHEVRYFSEADGVREGHYAAIEATSEPDSSGHMRSHVVVVPVASPEGWVSPIPRCSNCARKVPDTSHMFEDEHDKDMWDSFFREEYGYMCPTCWKAFDRGRDAKRYNLNVLENNG